MSGLRIIAGTMKGREIPFDNRKFDNADITPQKVKGAIFSMIGEWLHGKSFLDLYAGSGQIGIEALSRGANPVVFNEADIRRFLFIKSFLQNLGILSGVELSNLPDVKALEMLRDGNSTFDYIFLDPPYVKTKETTEAYHEIIVKIGECGILAPAGEIIIQHFSGNIIKEDVGPFQIKMAKKYGKTSLSVYG
jgi:16S rRNA (guanine966-N2)-methyltransferase